MLTDKQGNPLTGATAEAVTLFDQAVTAFNLYRGDPVELLDRALAAAPDFAMAPLMKAWLFAVATEPEATVYARSLVDHTKTLRLGERESSLLAALELLLADGWSAAALALDRHCMHYPRDLLALQCGHLLDFYRANARELRDRIARALPYWSPDMPGYSILLGMYAFGLEENGDYARAEATGRQAVAMEPLDCWAHHAVTHVMEMQGRAEDGIGWMMMREPYWSGDDNFFKVHNWWHRALYHLDLDQQDQALALYDGHIRAGRSSMALDMVDASALLWRLQLAGLALGERWQELSEAWDQHADGRLYPFNDWHAAMACLGAGRERALERLLQACRTTGRETGEAAAWMRTTGLPLIEGFVAFWRGDYPLAAEKLHGGRYIANRFGGSHAQRDIIDWTLAEAAVRGGLNDLAQALANERLALKPHSAVNRRFLSGIITR
ncbi:tetratricopeptide repeat protein [Zobellella maritima]|uniref:tetratricopeptide repeat protein n=1 Tax=Zobellella maritima TaxID=2059725 RepID=UPI000E30901D|nr:tetratricopeptide repeat protein [Zobellella maritima]